MPISQNSGRNLAFLPDLPEKDWQRAQQALNARNKARAADDERIRRQYEGIIEEAARRRHDLIGAKAVRDLHRFLQVEQQALTAKLQPPGGLKLDRDKAFAQRRRRVDTFVKSLGIAPGKLREIGQAATAAAQALQADRFAGEVAGFHLRDNLAKWQALSPFNALGHAFDLEPMEGWELVTPPFFGFLWRNWRFTGLDFVVSTDFEVDPPAGMVGASITMSVPDLGQYDMGEAYQEAMIAFAYRPAESGLVEVLIEAQNAVGIHDLKTENCFGISDSSTVQSNALFVEVLDPNVPENRAAVMSEFKKDTDDDNRWTFSNLTVGASFFAQLISTRPVAANRTAIVLVGTRTYWWSKVDDVKVSGTPNFRWFIRSVQIHIAPGTPQPPIA